MASHAMLIRETHNGVEFAEVEFFDRVRCRYVRRCMINGKPVARAAFDAALNAARSNEGV
jgi:hypothetical protein